MKRPSKHPWYRPKHFLHFDLALSRVQAELQVSNPDLVAKHDFMPLLHYVQKSRRFKRDLKTQKVRATTKPRKIFYAAHQDGYIFAYYNHLILEKYNKLLSNLKIDDCVLAYRKMERNGQKQSNIEMANEVFNSIIEIGECNVVCVDISDFFNNIDVGTLKEKWCQTLEEPRLPNDHYNIFFHVTNFRYVEEENCREFFNRDPWEKLAPGSNRYTSLCSPKELRDIHRRNKLRRVVKKKIELDEDGKPFWGIPQGLALSGLLANVFMIDFDVQMKNLAKEWNGIYRRYSDDILVVFDKKIEFDHVIKKISSILQTVSLDKLFLNPKKTEKREFRISNKKLECRSPITHRLSRLQYLGFTFDGVHIFLRNSSISRNRQNISSAIRQNKKGHKKINTKIVYKKYSPRIITPFDDRSDKGFVSYAVRSAKIHKSDKIISQIKKNDKFIAGKIATERVHRRRYKPKLGS